MDSSITKLIAAIEEVAAETGMAPSTVGAKVGQGGRFYARLKAGKRVWPETAETVHSRLAELRKATQISTQNHEAAA